MAVKLLLSDSGPYLFQQQVAARLGNRFAQSQVVRMNPYAKLCNRMLCEAMQKLREGERTEQ